MGRIEHKETQEAHPSSRPVHTPLVMLAPLSHSEKGRSRLDVECGSKRRNPRNMAVT